MQAMGDRSETNSFVVRPFIYLRSSLKLTWVGKDNLGPEEAHQLSRLIEKRLYEQVVGKQ